MVKSRPTIRVLLVDHHALVRQGIQSRLRDETDITVIGEADGVTSALARFRSLKPDVVLMEPIGSDLSGSDAITTLLDAYPRAAVIVLTAASGDLGAHHAIAAGARAYLLKGRPQTDLADTIRAAMNGVSVIDPEVKRELAARSGERKLTLTEVRVLRLAAEGLTNREIGDRLAIAEGTVKNHVKRILVKLDAADRIHAVILGIARGLLDTP